MPVQDPNKVTKVVVHPLVLLSVVDHFNRMGKVGNMKRVVGVLLGSNRQGVLDVSNSFAGMFDLDVDVFIFDFACQDGNMKTCLPCCHPHIQCEQSLTPPTKSGKFRKLKYES